MEKKKIKIIKVGEKALGIRLSLDLYEDIKTLADNNECSLQEVIKYILQEEIKNYL
jgi:hypothetical protein